MARLPDSHWKEPMATRPASHRSYDPEPTNPGSSLTHPCNDLNLSPIEFLQAIALDQTFSPSIQRRARMYLAMIHAREWQPRAILHIPDPTSYEYLLMFERIRE
jgi:hypothetical protein